MAEPRRDDFIYSNGLTLGAGIGTPDQMEIKTQQDSYFVVQTMMAKSAGAFLARMQDDGTGQSWQSNFVMNDNTFGSAQRPAIMINPIIIPPSARVLFDLHNGIAGPNALEICLGGYKLFVESLAADKKRPDQWFQYVGDKIVAANNLDTVNIRLQADSNFVVQKAMAVSTGAFEARLSDSGSGKAWSDRFINSDNSFGTAQRPRVLPFPRMVESNRVVQVEVRDLSGFPNTIEIVLEGVKKFPG